jgi:hypothetical protein
MVASRRGVSPPPQETDHAPPEGRAGGPGRSGPARCCFLGPLTRNHVLCEVRPQLAEMLRKTIAIA